MSQREIASHISLLGPQVAKNVLIRAALGDWDATKLLFPYVVPKVARASAPISDAVEIDLSTTETAKKALRDIAAAIGTQKIGLEEGTMLMDMVGRALDRIGTADLAELTERLDALEANPVSQRQVGSATQPVSRANGSTPTWGNIVKLPVAED